MPGLPEIWLVPQAGVQGGVCVQRRIQDSERFREGCRTALFVLLFFLVLFAAGFLTATAQTRNAVRESLQFGSRVAGNSFTPAGPQRTGATGLVAARDVGCHPAPLCFLR